MIPDQSQTGTLDVSHPRRHSNHNPLTTHPRPATLTRLWPEMGHEPRYRGMRVFVYLPFPSLCDLDRVM